MVTVRTPRTKPTTNWSERKKPIIYVAPLQDAYRKVHDQNNEIIYIISDTGYPVAVTKRTPRPTI